MSDNVFHLMLLTDDDYHFLNGDATSLKYLHDDIYYPEDWLEKLYNE